MDRSQVLKEFEMVSGEIDKEWFSPYDVMWLLHELIMHGEFSKNNEKS